MWQQFYQFLDKFLIPLYRFIPDPITAFFVGTFLLALMTVLIGEFSISLAFWFNRRYVEKLNNELIKWNNLSIEAIEAGDKKAYKGCNDQANDVFGKLFFISIAYAAASLWPIPFALGWMQYRFFSLELPLPFKVPFLGKSVGYTFVFIVLYLLARIIFSYLKPYLPYFARIEAMLKEYEKQQVKMKSFADLLEEKKG